MQRGQWEYALRGLSAQGRQLVDGCMKPVKVSPSGLVYGQGTAAKAMFVIRAGKVRLFKRYADGTEFMHSVAHEGDLIGAPECLSEQPYCCTAEALEPVVASVMDISEFKRRFADTPHFASNLAHLLAIEAMRNLNRATRIAEPPLIRLLNMLVELASKRQSEAEIKGDQAHIALTHVEIARMIGLSRGWVTESLAKLATQRLLKTQNRKIEIESISKLVAFLTQMERHPKGQLAHLASNAVQNEFVRKKNEHLPSNEMFLRRSGSGGNAVPR